MITMTKLVFRDVQASRGSLLTTLRWRGFALLTAGAIGIAVTATAARADFADGWNAYEQGDFLAAYGEWRPLADQGDVRAQFNIGVMYDEGKGLTQDRSKAIEWWTKAAENGDSQAQHNLGTGLSRRDRRHPGL